MVNCFLSIHSLVKVVVVVENDKLLFVCLGEGKYVHLVGGLVTPDPPEHTFHHTWWFSPFPCQSHPFNQYLFTGKENSSTISSHHFTHKIFIILQQHEF